MFEHEEAGAKSETRFWLFREGMRLTTTLYLGAREGMKLTTLYLGAREEVRLAILYLVAIAGAEVVTNFFSLVVGVICHTILLAVLIVHSSLVGESPSHKLLLALCLAPLTRIMSLSMPLAQFSPIYWYLIIYPALFLAAWVAMRRLNLTASEVGLTVRKLPLQLVVALTGFIFGVAEYLILRPEPLISELYWGAVLFPAFVLLAGSGFVEEFVFRGVLQRASMGALGRWGLPYVALVFAVLHLIHLSAIDIAFVFAIALFFGWVVYRTGSLLGVTLSHGITNILLYLIIPFLLPAVGWSWETMLEGMHPALIIVLSALATAFLLALGLALESWAWKRGW